MKCRRDLVNIEPFDSYISSIELIEAFSFIFIGRTGTMFACEWLDGGVRPDIIVMAKGLGNGFPISAIATRSELSAKQPPGSMGGKNNSTECI